MAASEVIGRILPVAVVVIVAAISTFTFGPAAGGTRTVAIAVSAVRTATTSS